MLKFAGVDPTSPREIHSVFEEFAREVILHMLTQALRLEAEEYLDRHKDLLDGEGKRLVVANGVGRARALKLESNVVTVNQPRVHDRREGHKFKSEILPPYLRKSMKTTDLISMLYLKNPSPYDFQLSLAKLLGDGAMRLSPTSIVELKTIWDIELAKWEKRLLSCPEATTN